MVTREEWQKRARELEREGYEITVLGRQGRLKDERTRSATSSDLIPTPSPDHSQNAFFSASEPDLRLLAPAGSGKTLSLLWRAKHLVEAASGRGESHRVIVFTFTRAARDELLKRLSSDSSFEGVRSSINVDTLNRYGFRYLKGIQTGLTLRSSRQHSYALINTNLRPLWSRQPLLKSILETGRARAQYARIMELFDVIKESGFRHDAEPFQDHWQTHVAWLAENGLSRFYESGIVERVEAIGFAPDGPDSLSRCSVEFLQFWRDATQHLWESAAISLADQKYWTWVQLDDRTSPGSKVPEPSRFHHIMVDEFQDISPLDLFLIRKLAALHRSSLTLVGDDDQAIFEWRGASPEFILHPDRHFERSFASHVLEVNYRSPANLVERSKSLIKNNKNRVAKTVTPHSQDLAALEVKHVDSHNDAIDLLLHLAKDAERAKKPRSLAILARKKSQIIPVQILLTSESVPFYAKEDLNVLLSDAFQQLRKILHAVATQNEPRMSEDITNSLLACCNMAGRYQLRRDESNRLWGHVRRTNPRTFADALAALQDFDGSFRGAKNANIRYEYAIKIAKVMEARGVADAIVRVGEHFEGLQQHYAKAQDDIFYKDPPFLYLAEYAQRYGTDYIGFMNHVENTIAAMVYQPDDHEGDRGDPDSERPVHVMTALRAKGKEFDTVAILDANEGIWPIQYAREERELEQERRLFYVAVTRARKKLLLMPVASMLDLPASPTRYISEMGL